MSHLKKKKSLRLHVQEHRRWKLQALEPGETPYSSKIKMKKTRLMRGLVSIPIRNYIKPTMEDEKNISRGLGAVPEGFGSRGRLEDVFWCVLTNGGAGAFKTKALAHMCILKLCMLVTYTASGCACAKF